MWRVWRSTVESNVSSVPVEERLERLEKAVSVMAWWLVQAQTGFGRQDAIGIDDILKGVKK